MRSWVSGFLLVLVVAAAACTSGGGSGGGDDDDDDDGVTNPTYWADIHGILDANCRSCHVTGGIGPFPLTSYTEAFPQASGIGIVTQSRYMPPANIDNSGACNTFSDARWLSNADIATIQNWVAAGAPEGNPADAPAPVPTPIQNLAEVDAELDMSVDYTPALAPDEYRCFLVDPGLATDQYLTAYKTVPGNDAIVHHVVLFLPTNETEEADAQALDDASPAEPGYQCFGGAQVGADVITVWAPGTGATFFPAGTGIEIPAGRRLVMQMHYNTAAGGGSDRTVVELDLEAAVGAPARIVPLGTLSFTIPPGEDSYPVSASQSAPIGGTIHMLYPHMHKRGETLQFTINGGCQADVPRWNFGWQQFFTPTTPIDVSTGDDLDVTCTFDTQGDTNPIPAGEGTDEEMCGVGLYVTL